MSSFFNYHIKGRVKLALERVQLNQSTAEPLLVFTMAKVGSSSVYNSVKHTTKLPAFHIHSLDEEGIGSANERLSAEGLYPDSRSPVTFLNSDIIEKKRPFKVISLFRNPVERNLSAFFDAFRLMVGCEAHEYKGSLDDLVSIFYKKINHDYPILWFAEYFNTALGLNLYDHRFDKEIGYSSIEKDDFSVLLMNSAIADDVKESAISDFLNETSFKLTNANVRSVSKAADLYRDFKAHIALERSYLDRMLNNEYFKHFFREEERVTTLEKWLKL